jgi:branched-chain amino acid transport system permease protein
MYFVKKTGYDYDLDLLPRPLARFWYALLGVVLLSLPLVAPPYLVSQATFVGIFCVAGLGLAVLTGYCGQLSLGHAAFMGIGAYGCAVLQGLGVPLVLALPAGAVIAAAAGLIVGLPALRLSGMYLAIATLAFAFIVEEVISRWDGVTRGASGLNVPRGAIFGWPIDSGARLYLVVLIVAVSAMLLVRNLLRSPLGQAFMAVRESQIAAQSLGIHPARVKLIAFSLSAALTGLGGALYAQAIRFISPDQFGIGLSVELLVVIFVGGIGTLHGVVFGAVFLIVLPQAISLAKDFLPAALAGQTGLQSALYALVLLLFILFEPQGLAGLWFKLKHYATRFPWYRKGSLKRTRSYARSETW